MGVHQGHANRPVYHGTWPDKSEATMRRHISSVLFMPYACRGDAESHPDHRPTGSALDLTAWRSRTDRSSRRPSMGGAVPTSDLSLNTVGWTPGKRT